MYKVIHKYYFGIRAGCQFKKKSAVHQQQKDFFPLTENKCHH